MMSVLVQCLRQKRSAADEVFFGLLKELFLQIFLLRRHTVNEQHYQALCLIDYHQQFAAIDQVCCRKVSFFKMAVPHRAIGPLGSLKN